MHTDAMHSNGHRFIVLHVTHYVHQSRTFLNARATTCGGMNVDLSFMSACNNYCITLYFCYVHIQSLLFNISFQSLETFHMLIRDDVHSENIG